MTTLATPAGSTGATLSATDRHNLASELLDASADSRNCFASGYHLYRRLLGFYGFDVASMDAQGILRIAQYFIAEVPVEAAPANAQTVAFEAQRKSESKAKRSNKPQVGQTISYKTPLGEERVGVVQSVSASGKSIYVTRPDGSTDCASRSIAVIG